jgi:hypothetical protein
MLHTRLSRVLRNWRYIPFRLRLNLSTPVPDTSRVTLALSLMWLTIRVNISYTVFKASVPPLVCSCVDALTPSREICTSIEIALTSTVAGLLTPIDG